MSGNQPFSGPAIPPAERLRSLLVATTSIRLHLADHRADLMGRHRVLNDRLMIDLPIRSHLARHLLRYGDAVAVVEITGLVPTPVRNRTRDRATLTGWLTPVDTRASSHVDSDEHVDAGAGAVVEPDAGRAGPELTGVFDLAIAELDRGDAIVPISPEEFAAARPDPFAASEAELLCHLDARHPETVRRLARLTPAGRAAEPVHAVRPVALDRLGLTLRLEFPDREHDVRLAFPAPLHQRGQVLDVLRTMLARPVDARPGPD